MGSAEAELDGPVNQAGGGYQGLLGGRGCSEPWEAGTGLYFGMIIPQSEIKALLKAYQVFSLSICPPQGFRAVSTLAPVPVLEEAVALTDPQAKIRILSRQDWLPLGIHDQLR